LLTKALAEGEAEAAARVVIDKALAGNLMAARFLVERLCPKPRGRAITLALPENESAAGDVVAMFNSAFAGAGGGADHARRGGHRGAVPRRARARAAAWDVERKVTNSGRGIPVRGMIGSRMRIRRRR